MVSDGYTFELPPELVAQDPPTERGDSRLLVVDRRGGVDDLRGFTDLPDLLAAGDLLVCNDSRVLPARLWTRREDSGGRVELLLLHREPEQSGWRALARPVRRLRPGLVLVVQNADAHRSTGIRLRIDSVEDDGEVVVTDPTGADLVALAETHGDIPLPPYIRRDPAAPGASDRRRRDRDRYQTVYAREDYAAGASVAAPTAGLHFGDDVLAQLDRRGIDLARVTLHVGPGTFRVPSDLQIASRRLHPEAFEMPATTAAAIASCRERGGRVIAVGTTSLRVLETVERLELPAVADEGTRHRYPRSAAEGEPLFEGVAHREAGAWTVQGITRLFIQPPDAVTAADGLLTNFHLPGSSLLMLVSAFAGETTWRQAYREAVARRLRFYSYGDAMLIRPAPSQESP